MMVCLQYISSMTLLTNNIDWEYSLHWYKSSTFDGCSWASLSLNTIIWDSMSQQRIKWAIKVLVDVFSWLFSMLIAVSDYL